MNPGEVYAWVVYDPELEANSKTPLAFGVLVQNDPRVNMYWEILVIDLVVGETDIETQNQSAFFSTFDDMVDRGEGFGWVRVFLDENHPLAGLPTT